jgi:hypothetical protein
VKFLSLWYFLVMLYSVHGRSTSAPSHSRPLTFPMASQVKQATHHALLPSSSGSRNKSLLLASASTKPDSYPGNAFEDSICSCSTLRRGWDSYYAGAMYVHLNYLTLFKPVVAYFTVLESTLGVFSIAVAMGLGSHFWFQHDVVTKARVFSLVLDRAHSWVSWPMRYVWNRYSMAGKMIFLTDKPLVKVAIANLVEAFFEEVLFRGVPLYTIKKVVCLVSPRWRKRSIRDDLIKHQNAHDFASKLKYMPPVKNPEWSDLLQLSPWAFISSTIFGGMRLGFVGQKKTIFGKGFDGQKDRIYILSCWGQAIKGFYSSAYVLVPVYESQGLLAVIGAHTAMLFSAPLFWVRLGTKYGPRVLAPISEKFRSKKAIPKNG